MTLSPFMQVVYFRAHTPGACDYVNDGRYWRYSHGTCWSELADDLTVIDVPGDHFSLLRQASFGTAASCVAPSHDVVMLATDFALLARLSDTHDVPMCCVHMRVCAPATSQQDPPDMEPLIAALKLRLGSFGWAEAVRRDGRASQWRGSGAVAAVAELDDYLERMGVRCGTRSGLGSSVCSHE